MVHRLLLLFLLLVRNESGITQVRMGDFEFGHYDQDDFGEDVDMSADGSIVAIGNLWNYDTAYHPGYVRIIQWNGDAWEKLGDEIIGIKPHDAFGSCVDLSADGHTIVIGAYNDPVVQVYTFGPGGWKQVGHDIYKGHLSQAVRDVAISDDGKIIAYGVCDFPQIVEHRGVVRVFEFNDIDQDWQQVGDDFIGEVEKGAAGWQVALSADGQTLAYVALGDVVKEVEGYIRVFSRQNGEWHQKGSIEPDGILTLVQGWSLSLAADGNMLSFGTLPSTGDEPGTFVQVFRFVNDVWKMVDGPIRGYIHSSLSGNGQRIAVSRASHTTCPVIVLDLVDGSWTQMGHTITSTFEYEWPGSEISLANDGQRLVAASAYKGGAVAMYDLSQLEIARPDETCAPLDTVQEGKEITILPNPTKGRLYITGVDLTDQHEQNIIHVYSIAGQQLHVFVLSANEIDISHLPSGIYFIKIHEFVEKLVKVD